MSRRPMPARLKFRGEVRTPQEWADHLGISIVSFRQRWNHYVTGAELFRRGSAPAARAKAQAERDLFADHDYFGAP